MLSFDLEESSGGWSITSAVASFIALVVLVSLFLVVLQSRQALVMFLGLLATVGVIYAIVYSSIHREWLIVTLIVGGELLGSFLLPKEAQRAGHYLLYFLVGIPALPLMKRYGILSKGGFRLYAIYFCWAAITIIYSLDPVMSIARLLAGVLVFAAISVIAFEVNTREDIERLFERLALGCGAVMAITAALGLVTSHDLNWGQTEIDPSALDLATRAAMAADERFHGLFNSPNEIGALMLVAVGSSLVCWPASRGWKRFFIAATIVLSILLAGLADSRTPFVALAIGGVSFLLWKFRSKGIVIFLVLAILVGVGLRHIHLPGAHSEAREDSTLTGRTDVWQFTLEQLELHPLRGYGYGVEGQLFKSRFFPLWWGPWDLSRRISVHNGFLGRAVGLGVLGLAFWLFIVLRPWFVLFFRNKDDPWNLKPVAFLIVVPVLVHNMAESYLQDFVGQVSLAFGLAWALAERNRIIAIERQIVSKADEIAKMPRAVGAAAGMFMTAIGIVVLNAPFLKAHNILGGGSAHSTPVEQTRPLLLADLSTERLVEK
jgi:O-antigen ligase